MKRLLMLLVAAVIGWLPNSLTAQNTHASLLLSAATAKPGDTVMAGVRLKMDAGWHTYWVNGGDSGDPTKIKWTLPNGITAGEIQWPPPEKAVTDDLYTYEYHEEVILLVPLTLAPTLPKVPVEIKAAVSWLECKVACVPGDAEVTAELVIADETKPATAAATIDSWQKKLPAKKAEDLKPRATWGGPAAGKKRPLIIEWTLPAAPAKADFFPYPGKDFDVGNETKKLSLTDGKVHLEKEVQLNSKEAKEWPKTITGLLISADKDGHPVAAWEVSLPLEGSPTSGAVAMLTNPAASGSLLGMLGLAFLGGLILNIMPCVFPVIALKILGFVQQTRDEPGRVFTLGLIYGAGVLVSFLVMAGLVIAIQQAGGSASWGMQFRNPQISVGFIAMVVLIALNLFGVFEVNLGGRTMGAAGELASKHGAAGAFFNGILATVLATPCTAPLLASALGFAFAQPPLIILLFFLTIGLGLALPYVLLSWKPGWLKFLPRPGAWMEKFKVAMGFPMLATAVWIFWFTAPRFGEDGIIWVGFFLIGLAFAVWIWGAFVQHGSRRRGLAVAFSLLVLLGSYGYTLESKLHWRTPLVMVAEGKLQNDKDGVQWEPWSAAAVTKAQSEGRPVLIDFTAKWCVTCNTLVKPAVNNQDVRRKLEAVNGVALLADNTNYPADIMAELKKFHSDASVPLVLVYSRDAAKPPKVLPTIPSRNDVLEALTEAAL